MRMKKRNFIYLVILAFGSLSGTGKSQHKKEIIAYFPQWGIEHQPYYVKFIETTGAADKITELNYAFAVPGPDSIGKIGAKFMNAYYDYQQVYSAEMSIDGQADDSVQSLRGHFNQLKKLKARHPNLKVLVSIGGWLGSTYFSDAALTEESREVFTESCINTFIRGNLPVERGAGGKGVAAGIFDGIDVDWEYPMKGGAEGIHHNENDKNNLTKLYALFRKKLDAINPDLILTAAVPAKDDPAQLFNIKEDTKYLNWYLLMTYDFCGGWDRRTGHHANPLTNPNTPLSASMDATVRKYRNDYGIPADKIIPGAAFYGRSWKNVESDNNGFNQPGTIGPGIYEAGVNYYADIIPLRKRGYKVSWDTWSMAETMYNPEEKIFWTYDETQSIALKGRYVDAYDLRGIMFWEISGDDSMGTLVNTIYTRQMPDVQYDTTKLENVESTVFIKKPAANTIITKGSNLIVDVATEDPDGKIVKVEFFVDDKSIGYDTKFPFSWVWFNTTSGEHTMKVIATDNNGASTISKPVLITVN
jgi:chitinase